MIGEGVEHRGSDARAARSRYDDDVVELGHQTPGFGRDRVTHERAAHQMFALIGGDPDETVVFTLHKERKRPAKREVIGPNRGEQLEDVQPLSNAHSTASNHRFVRLPSKKRGFGFARIDSDRSKGVPHMIAHLRFARAAFFAAALVAIGLSSIVSATEMKGALPAGGKYKDCHGYILHVSDANIRVHCIDGTPADLSFLQFPKYGNAKDGKSMQVRDLQPNTPVHVIFTQSLGVRHAYKIYVADPNGHGLYGFKS